MNDIRLWIVAAAVLTAGCDPRASWYGEYGYTGTTKSVTQGKEYSSPIEGLLIIEDAKDEVSVEWTIDGINGFKCLLTGKPSKTASNKFRFAPKECAYSPGPTYRSTLSISGGEGVFSKTTLTFSISGAERVTRDGAFYQDGTFSVTGMSILD